MDDSCFKTFRLRCRSEFLVIYCLLVPSSGRSINQNKCLNHISLIRFNWELNFILSYVLTCSFSQLIDAFEFTFVLCESKRFILFSQKLNSKTWKQNIKSRQTDRLLLANFRSKRRSHHTALRNHSIASPYAAFSMQLVFVRQHQIKWNVVTISESFAFKLVLFQRHCSQLQHIQVLAKFVA